jgi:hypothetical protein
LLKKSLLVTLNHALNLFHGSVQGLVLGDAEIEDPESSSGPGSARHFESFDEFFSSLLE